MTGIFFGDARQVARVYELAVVRQLEREAGLDGNAVLTRAELPAKKALARETEAIFSTWGMPALTEAEIADCFPKLKAVFYAAGSVQGFARPFLARGVRVFSAWAANAVPVAEFAAAQILLANKGFFQAAARAGRGETAEARAYTDRFPGNYRCKVGLVGAGMIGKLVIEALRRHELEILVFDPFLPDREAQRLGVWKGPLETIFSECRTVSNHLANNAKTVGMLDYSLFSRMPAYSTFINTGRGAQVVEKDLVRALTEEPGRTALLDVTDPEPPAQGHPFYTLPNVFLTPHIAGSTGDEVMRMARYMLEEFRLFRNGGPVRYEVTPEMLETMA